MLAESHEQTGQGEENGREHGEAGKGRLQTAPGVSPAIGLGVDELVGDNGSRNGA